MAKFAYVATTLEGVPVKGVKRASTLGDAELDLYDRGLRGLQVAEKRSVLQYEISGPRIERADLMHLSRQLAAFLHAGLPILEAVRTLGAETENSSLRRMMLEIEDGLRSGERFSDCLNRHPKVFPSYYRGIVESAELTGELDAALGQLSLYLERDLEARRRIKSASTYPAVIAAMSVVTVIVLSVFVLPKFRDFFASLDAKLPLTTRMLLAMTQFLTAQWPMVVAGIVGVAVLGFVVFRFERCRYARDGLLLRVPVLGETIRFALVERFCRVLASMVSAGVTLPEAVRVATESMSNRVFARGLQGVTEAMLEGQGIAMPLARTHLFPGTATQMLRVGEETGSLDHQLELTASYYEVELDYKIKKLTSLFEPLVIVVMGLVVGFVAVALIQAMYGIFNQVKF